MIEGVSQTRKTAGAVRGVAVLLEGACLQLCRRGRAHRRARSDQHGDHLPLPLVLREVHGSAPRGRVERVGARAHHVAARVQGVAVGSRQPGGGRVPVRWGCVVHTWGERFRQTTTAPQTSHPLGCLQPSPVCDLRQSEISRCRCVTYLLVLPSPPQGFSRNAISSLGRFVLSPLYIGRPEAFS